MGVKVICLVNPPSAAVKGLPDFGFYIRRDDGALQLIGVGEGKVRTYVPGISPVAQRPGSVMTLSHSHEEPDVGVGHTSPQQYELSTLRHVQHAAGSSSFSIILTTGILCQRRCRM